MGDVVKITVIATGFKQQEMPQRRERMLAEATLPTMRYDVPIQPRVSTQRSEVPRVEAPRVEAPRLDAARPEAPRAEALWAEPQRSEPLRAELPRSEAPRFASEPAPQPPVVPVAPVAPMPEVRVVEARDQGRAVAENARPELLPVPASVFDDDFFRYSAPVREPVREEAQVDRVEAVSPDRFREPTHLSAPMRVQQEDTRVISDALLPADTVARSPSFGGTTVDQTEPDELDIPAFLRRGK
jgi:cell division protein FtsZ